MTDDYDPHEGFRLLFPNSKRPPIVYSREQVAKIKAWLALPEEERKNKWPAAQDRFAYLFPDTRDEPDQT